MEVGREAAGPASRRRPPWGLIGMLVLVAAVETRLSGHDLDFTAPWHWDWRTANHQVRRKLSDRQVLLFGDSLMKFGVMPRVVRERSGKATYNLALHTGQTSSSYFMLRRALEAGSRPSAVVLDLTPHMFRHKPEENARLWPELLGLGECLDLARTMRDPGFFAATTLARALPSYKERHEIRAGLMAALRGQAASRRGEIPIYRRNWKVNDGGQLNADGPAPAIDPVHWERTLYRHWRPDPVNLAYLDRFLDLARSAGVPAYWLLPPIHPEVQSRTDASGFDADYSRFARALQARFASTVVVVDARHSGFAADQFMDGVHLNRRGALRLSAALGELLRDPQSGAGRWVALDPSRARAFDLPIEDVWQSHLALKAAWGAIKR